MCSDVRSAKVPVLGCGREWVGSPGEKAKDLPEKHCDQEARRRDGEEAGR